MAAIDPVTHGLATILSNRLVHDAVVAWESERGFPPLSPRLLALEQLRSKKVCEALAAHVREALGPGEITYRELWNFVAEMLLEGDNDTVPPTSPWFWRLFYGDNSLSVRVSAATKPSHLSLPEVSMALYLGDLSALGLDQGVLQLWVPAGGTASDHSDRQAVELVRWNRIQYVVLAAWLSSRVSVPFVGSRRDGRGSGALPSADLVALMNGFFRRGRRTSRQVLELWVDLGVERRQDRPPGIVSLGVVSLSQLSVVTSSVIANIARRQLMGARQFLRAEGPGGLSTTIELNSGLMQGLLRGRNHRTFHRSGDETDLALKRFYFGCARVCSLEEPDVLEILQADDDGTTQTIRWRVGERLHRLGGSRA
jgi:hypothetical protein